MNELDEAERTILSAQATARLTAFRIAAIVGPAWIVWGIATATWDTALWVLGGFALTVALFIEWNGIQKLFDRIRGTGTESDTSGNARPSAEQEEGLA